MVLGAEEELRGLGGMGSSEALGGSLPKLTRSWAITPSAVCDLWLMAFGRQPAPYLHACLPAWLINVEPSTIPLVTWVNTSKERKLTVLCVSDKKHISLQQNELIVTLSSKTRRGSVHAPGWISLNLSLRPFGTFYCTSDLNGKSPCFDLACCLFRAGRILRVEPSAPRISVFHLLQ